MNVAKLLSSDPNPRQQQREQSQSNPQYQHQPPQPPPQPPVDAQQPSPYPQYHPSFDHHHPGQPNYQQGPHSRPPYPPDPHRRSPPPSFPAGPQPPAAYYPPPHQEHYPQQPFDHRQPPPPASRHLPPPHAQDPAPLPPPTTTLPPPPHPSTNYQQQSSYPSASQPPPRPAAHAPSGHKPRRSFEKAIPPATSAFPHPSPSDVGDSKPPSAFSPPRAHRQSHDDRQRMDDSNPSPKEAHNRPPTALGVRAPPSTANQIVHPHRPPSAFGNQRPYPPQPSAYGPPPPSGPYNQPPSSGYGPPQTYGPPPPHGYGPPVYAPPPPAHYQPGAPLPPQQYPPPPSTSSTPAHHHHVHHHHHHHSHSQPPGGSYPHHHHVRRSPNDHVQSTRPYSRDESSRAPQYASAQQIQQQSLPPPPSSQAHHHHLPYPPPSQVPPSGYAPPHPGPPPQAVPPHHQPQNQTLPSQQPALPTVVPPTSPPAPTQQQLQTSAAILAAFAAALKPAEVAKLPHLGTFVYPNLPLPIGKGATGSQGELFLEPKTKPEVSDDELVAKPESSPPLPDPVVTGVDVLSNASFLTMTVLMASGHLLTPQTVPGRLDGTFKLWGSQSYGGYTDDSDLRLVLLHSGLITLEEMAKAKQEDKDLRIVLRVGRYPRGRYVGGPTELASGPPPKKRAKHEPTEVKIKSFAWGNSHDGGSLEVITVDIVKRGAAHSRHAPNRKARMAQYARQRARLNMAPMPDSFRPGNSKGSVALADRAERFITSPVSDSYTIIDDRSTASGATLLDHDVQREAAEVGKWGVVFSWGQKGANDTGANASFTYEPSALQEAMFAPTPTQASRKRTRDNDDLGARTDAFVLENNDERYYVLPLERDPRSYKVVAQPLKATLPPSTSEPLVKMITENGVLFDKQGVSLMFTGPEPSDNEANGQGNGFYCQIKRWRFACPGEIAPFVSARVADDAVSTEAPVVEAVHS